jgi:hypothetical protein
MTTTPTKVIGKQNILRKNKEGNKTWALHQEIGGLEGTCHGEPAIDRAQKMRNYERIMEISETCREMFAARNTLNPENIICTNSPATREGLRMNPIDERTCLSPLQFNKKHTNLTQQLKRVAL